jgi:putative ABC transport system substrate-binding protein
MSLSVLASARKMFDRQSQKSQDATRESSRSESIRLALHELGYIDRQNIAIEYRYAEGKPDRQSELASELVRLKVDIIVTGGTGPVRAAKNATKTIPIVMLGHSERSCRSRPN